MLDMCRGLQNPQSFNSPDPANLDPATPLTLPPCPYPPPVPTIYLSNCPTPAHGAVRPPLAGACPAHGEHVEPLARPIPTSKRRSPKSLHRPDKTVHIAPKIALNTPIRPHIPPQRPAQINGNERKRAGFTKNHHHPSPNPQSCRRSASGGCIHANTLPSEVTP